MNQIKRSFRPARGVALLLAAAFFVLIGAATLPMASAVTQDQINDLRSQAADLSAQKADLQKKLDSLDQSKNDAMAQKDLLTQKIGVLQQEIAVSEESIHGYTQMIAQKEVELEEAQAKEKEYYELFCSRVRDMEEDGTVSYWAILFQANSFSDLLDRVNMVSEIMEYDNGIMRELAAAKKAVEDAKADLEKNKADEEAAQSTLTTQKADLVTEQQKVEKLLAQINAQSNTYSNNMENLEEDAVSVAQQISQAEATYAAQLAAQKKAAAKAAAEKARKAAAEKAAAAKAAQRGNSGGSASSGSSSSGGSSNGGSTTVNPGGSGGYIWPVPSSTHISSPFGYRNCPYHGWELHGGVDITASYGASIVAAKSGVVIISTYGSSYGNYVVIAHGDGTRTLYGHMSSRAVSPGSTVSQGQAIGYVGSTGSSTGNHCHFEIWTGSSSNSRVNPMNYF